MSAQMVEALKGLIVAVGKVIDVLVPVGVGKRTQIAVVACPLLALATPFVGMIPGAAPFAALLPVLQTALCGAAPAFALAGLVRKK